VDVGMLAHLPVGTGSITLSSAGPGRFFVIGGVPFDERLIMWWTFVGRTTEEIVTARNAWATGNSAKCAAIAEIRCPPLPCLRASSRPG
jgi:redox-sensitive bicupin YhaK (pirin superfamily)